MPTVHQKGYSLPIVFFILLALLALPAYFWFSSNTFNASASNRNVRGVSHMGQAYDRPGFSVSVTSSAQTWDLVVYLCKTREECVRSANSGYRFSTTSGGKTDFQEIVVEADSSWDSYSFVKYYVRSGWYTQSKIFNITTLGDVKSAEEHSLADGRFEYSAVILPIEDVTGAFYRSAHFSDY